MNNIILCGLPMCGKTTIGRLLAKQLDWIFVDSDDLIEKAYALKTGKNYVCSQIFREEGEKGFRSMEKQQIASLPGTSKSIIAVGGGSLCDSDNTLVLQSVGALVYLQTAANIIWQRLHANGIPAYLKSRDPEKEFQQIAKQRKKIYEQAAFMTIEIGNSNAEEIASLIYTRIANGK